MLQDPLVCGNYHGNMGETPLLPRVPGSAGRPIGGPINWAAALAEHERWLRTVILARVGERQAVEEIMQEVALAAVAQRAPVLDVTRLAAWLYRLAIRQALLYRRRLGRQRRLLGKYADRQGPEQGLAGAPDALERLLQEERRALLRAALQRLPRRDAEILLLKYTEEWSYRELAAHLGVSESAVEARLHRARRRLRETLAGTHNLEDTI